MQKSNSQLYRLTSPASTSPKAPSTPTHVVHSRSHHKLCESNTFLSIGSLALPAKATSSPVREQRPKQQIPRRREFKRQAQGASPSDSQPQSPSQLQPQVQTRTLQVQQRPAADRPWHARRGPSSPAEEGAISSLPAQASAQPSNSSHDTTLPPLARVHAPTPSPTPSDEHRTEAGVASFVKKHAPDQDVASQDTICGTALDFWNETDRSDERDRLPLTNRTAGGTDGGSFTSSSERPRKLPPLWTEPSESDTPHEELSRNASGNQAMLTIKAPFSPQASAEDMQYGPSSKSAPSPPATPATTPLNPPPHPTPMPLPTPSPVSTAFVSKPPAPQTLPLLPAITPLMASWEREPSNLALACDASKSPKDEVLQLGCGVTVKPPNLPPELPEALATSSDVSAQKEVNGKKKTRSKSQVYSMDWGLFNNSLESLAKEA